MESPPKASFCFLPLLGPRLIHWATFGSLVSSVPGQGDVPCRGWGGPDSWQGPGLCHSINAFQNCCPLPVRIQEIVVETPALAAERARGPSEVRTRFLGAPTPSDPQGAGVSGVASAPALHAAHQV